MFGLGSSPHGIANQARIGCRNFTSSILCQFLKRFLPVAMCLQSIQYIQDVPATPLCVSHQDAWPPVHKLGTLRGKQSSLQAPICLLCRHGTPPCLPAPAYSKPHINIIFYQEPITLSKRSLRGFLQRQPDLADDIPGDDPVHYTGGGCPALLNRNFPPTEYLQRTLYEQQQVRR